MTAARCGPRGSDTEHVWHAHACRGCSVSHSPPSSGDRLGARIGIPARAMMRARVPACPVVTVSLPPLRSAARPQARTPRRPLAARAGPGRCTAQNSVPCGDVRARMASPPAVRGTQPHCIAVCPAGSPLSETARATRRHWRHLARSSTRRADHQRPLLHPAGSPAPCTVARGQPRCRIASRAGRLLRQARVLAARLLDTPRRTAPGGAGTVGTELAPAADGSSTM